MLDVLYPEEEGCQTGINKIQLRGLDQPFAQIAVVRREEFDDIAGFQNGKPALYRIVVDTAVIPQRGKIDDLATSRCTELEKCLKAGQVFNIDQQS